MKRLVTVPRTLLILISAALFLQGCGKKTHSSKKIIALTQIVEHKAIDAEREGFIQGLEDSGFINGKNIQIVYENAQGNIATATQIASKFVSMNPDVIVALTTPSAQSVVSAARKTSIPVVFSTVTDPVNVKIVSQIEPERSDNVTGISDFLPAAAQIDCIKKLIPNVKKIGVILNPGEANSILMLRDLKNEALKEKIEIVEATASKTSDVTSAAHSLVGKVDAILVQNDNTAVAAIGSIVSVGEKSHVPIFAADFGSFNAGVVAAMGYDRFQIGKQLATYVIRILKGEKASDMTVLTKHPILYRVNLTAAKKMGLSLDKNKLTGFDIQS